MVFSLPKIQKRYGTKVEKSTSVSKKKKKKKAQQDIKRCCCISLSSKSGDQIKFSAREATQANNHEYESLITFDAHDSKRLWMCLVNTLVVQVTESKFYYTSLEFLAVGHSRFFVALSCCVCHLQVHKHLVKLSKLRQCAAYFHFFLSTTVTLVWLLLHIEIPPFQWMWLSKVIFRSPSKLLTYAHFAIHI